jgi:hypothetical protein
MVPSVVIAAVATVPVLWSLFTRVNSVLLFLSVATGSLLQHSLGPSVSLAIATFYKDGPTDLIANIGLVCLPVLITMFLLRKSMKGTGVVLQIVPLMATGAALAALLLPLLPDAFREGVYDNPGGNVIRQSLDLVVAVAAGLNLLLAFSIYRHREGKHGKHHGH